MNRAGLKERLLYAGAYTSFFVFAFTLSVYFTFPYDRLRDFIVNKVGSESPADGMQLKIGELSPSWVTGVELSAVEITKPASGEDQAATLRFDSVTARASLLPLLLGSFKLGLTAHVGEGSLQAHFAQHETTRDIEAELDAIDVEKLGLGAWIGVPLKGNATGSVNLALDDDPVKSRGDIALKIESLHVADGKSKLKIPGMPGGMTLDELDAGTLDIALKITDGVAKFEHFATNGKDLKVDGEGNLRLANPLRRARLDLLIDLKFNDSYKTKSDRTKSLFELMGIQSEFRRATDPDGTLHLHISGSLQALRATPTSGAGRSNRESARKRAQPQAAVPSDNAP